MARFDGISNLFTKAEFAIEIHNDQLCMLLTVRRRNKLGVWRVADKMYTPFERFMDKAEAEHESIMLEGMNDNVK